MPSGIIFRFQRAHQLHFGPWTRQFRGLRISRKVLCDNSVAGQDFTRQIGRGKHETRHLGRAKHIRLQPETPFHVSFHAIHVFPIGYAGTADQIPQQELLLFDHCCRQLCFFSENFSPFGSKSTSSAGEALWRLLWHQF